MSADQLYRIEYWKDNVDEKGNHLNRTQGTPEDYTFRRIQFFNRRHYLYFDFNRLDGDIIMYGKIQHAITEAYNAGKAAKAAEIRNVLGC